jgi:hypothetical protein
MNDVDDNNFINVCTLLDKHKINYWICHGTLLGIVREQRLLPWDHDIDFAVWAHENEKEYIKKIMTSDGYVQELMSVDMDCLHFYGEGKKIDISFYKVNDGIASVKWASPPGSRVKKLAVFFLTNVIDGSQSVSGVRNPVKRAVLMFAKLLGGIVRNFSTVKMKENLVTITRKMMVYTGYSYPIELLEIARVNYKGYNIPIPLESDDCLEMTYGKEWKTPNKNYIWYQEAENLRTFE